MKNLNSSQLEIYLDQLKSKCFSRYNIGGYSEVKEYVDTSLLKSSFEALVRENPIFKTQIKIIDGKPYQDMDGEVPNFEVYDLSSNKYALEKANSLIQSILSEPISLHGGALARTGVIRLSSECIWYFGIAHHIICDGWGFANWLRRIFEWYAALRAGAKQPSVPALHQFDETLQEQRAWLEGEKYQLAGSYWCEKLNELPGLNFPEATHNEPRKSGFRRTPIDGDCFERLSRLAKLYNLSVQHFVIAALYAYFLRVGGGNTNVFGLPSHNRRGVKQKNLIGTLLGYTPLVITGGESDSLLDIAQQASATSRRGFRHQRFPLSHLHDLLGLHQKGLDKLFDIQFNYQPIDFDLSDLNLKSQTYYYTGGYVATPLVVTICDYGKQQPVFLQLDYQLDVFSHLGAELFESRFFHILKQIVENPQQSISQLKVITEQDSLHIARSAGPQVEPPAFHPLAQLNAVIDCTPQANAIFDSRWWSYAEIGQKIDLLSVRLQQMGVKEGDRIAICTKRNHGLIVAMASIWLCGAAFVPLDSSWPDARLNMMLEDSKVSLVLVEDATFTRFEGYVCPRLNISNMQNSVENTHWDLALVPDQIAYILFTSGSTGRPKGVEVGMTAFANFLNAMACNPGISASDRMLALTTVAFDISLLELWLPLVTGASVVIAAENVQKNPELLSDTLQTHDITHMQATPSGWRLLLSTQWRGKQGLTGFVGGEALEPQLGAKLQKCCERVFNLYGPTETTIWSSVYELGSEVNSAKRVSIGCPINNTKFHILDEQGRQLPPGVTGELHISGAGLAKGYFDAPDKTAEKFASRAMLKGERTYATGDLARLLDNGQYEILGRIDNQVKLNGFRIELDDIRNQIQVMPEIVDAVVGVTEQKGLQTALVAWYKVCEALTPNDIRQRLRQTLPAYMIPQIYMSVDDFPMTANGKKDLKRLPQPSGEDFLITQSRLPEGDLELIISKTICDVTGLTHIGAEDNYFDVGLSSMSLVTIAQRLNQALADHVEQEVDTTTVFSYPSVAQLAEFLAGKTTPKADAEQNIRKRQSGKNRLNKMLKKRKNLNA
ncbi:hypothetical protein CBQ28_15490 [Pseudoalteromonas sp. GCY]|uniref:non-ribosomal peptide synthetase n=1 Tax=Pseudoalteromonas sp. GCY TaxID=2003316 RepID=UPI000BFEBE92|nr:non-ribosomal peptide synthetase [Pseudoalteromonas sp. GCY]PHI36196.1 hypothetical protein CBQ28_15490 [Pseudoalteromonas sp. GCY]QQQ65447.1 non-ribosomal peptide synthetase [Pseudoalteromonas sp. GCY]